MNGVTIRDTNDKGLIFDLKDILLIVGEAAISSNWTARCVEAVGDGADEFDQTFDAEMRIRGTDLLKLLEKITQVIDGEFRAYRSGQQQPWLVIRAVDSSAFDVLSDEPGVLGLAAFYALGRVRGFEVRLVIALVLIVLWFVTSITSAKDNGGRGSSPFASRRCCCS